MIPFILTVALSFISFLASAFVILRIVIPILPPHPLSRRVAPSEFGLPNYNFRSLSAADKSHLWLASLDLLALSVFIWQAVSEYSGRATGLADTWDIAASARLWFALTIRQTCLLVVSALTVVHIRAGRSVSFGRKHWMIWTPTLLLSLTSTALAAVLAGAGVPSLFPGLIGYLTTTAILSTTAFGGLVYTLVVIRRNLTALNEPADSWPPVKEVEEKPRLSFATEDVDGLREGSSWLTSDAGSSRHESVSNWSFSTHHTRQGSVHYNPATSRPSLQLKSSYWFTPSASGADPSIPPVPPLPSVYRGNSPQTCAVNEDPDPFRRDVPSRPRLGSQSSWLSSPSVSQTTMSMWSYPATPITGSAAEGNVMSLSHTLPSRPATPMASAADLNATLLPQVVPSRPATPALSSAKVLGGYGYTTDTEKGITSLAVSGAEIDISYSRYVLWLLSIWVPFTLALPYLVSIASTGSASIGALPIMLVLSVTLSSPLLALNIVVRSPIPIPTGLFGMQAEPPSAVMRAPSPTDSLATYLGEYKRSGSVTVVEGRRSGDVWISQGDAVDGKGKIGRALGLITPLPRLAVLPLEKEKRDGEVTPPLPMQEDTFNTMAIPPTPQSSNSAELGVVRKESKGSSLYSGNEAFATKIMIAQRHYSAVATTVVLPASPNKTGAPNGLLGVATGVDVVPTVTVTSSSHLRSRSVSSITGHAVTAADASAPPCQPLPPTPPNIRSAKQTAKQLHRKSYSSDFSFSATVNDIKEIDALTAGVLPLLVPGLRLGEDMKIRDWEKFSPPLNSTVTKKKPTDVLKKSAGSEPGLLRRDDFASPRFHSTPAHGRRSHSGKKVSGHKRNSLSLPSLNLDKDAWQHDLDRELVTRTEQCTSLPPGDAANQRGFLPNLITHPVTENEVQHAPVTGGSMGRSMSTRNTGLRVEIPDGSNSARTSLATLIPPSAASTVTLFDAESIFEPSAQSTPCDAQKGHPCSKKYQTAGSCRSSIVYVKSDDESSEPVASVNRTASPMAGTVKRKSTLENKPASQSGGLRQLSLLKDRSSNKEGDASKLAGTRPLILAKKKQRANPKVPSDENANPNAGDKYLKPLQLRRSESSKIRGVLRRDEVLPTVVIRPPSTNAKMGSSYEYR